MRSGLNHQKKVNSMDMLGRLGTFAGKAVHMIGQSQFSQMGLGVTAKHIGAFTSPSTNEDSKNAIRKLSRI